MAEPVSESLLSYYRRTGLNAGEIRLETDADWQAQIRKRHNLYENHLQIPLALLRDRSVLEFGCASGENALVLAARGARLTLVEPNSSVIPRLRALFENFELTSQIARLSQDEIDAFQTSEQFDIALAEGFLFTLPNRDEIIARLCGWLKPGGIGVVSFNDRCGMLLECIKRLVLRRACQLAGVHNIEGEASFGLATQLFGPSYASLGASRAFRTWWKDNLVSKLLAARYLWSFQELLPQIERGGCEFYASSPKWSRVDHFTWYKKVANVTARHQRVLDDLRGVLVFLLLGVAEPDARPASTEVLDAVIELQEQISHYTTDANPDIATVTYSRALDAYLGDYPNPTVQAFNADMKTLFDLLRRDSESELVGGYQKLQSLQALWGTPYHYLAFKKSE